MKQRRKPFPRIAGSQTGDATGTRPPSVARPPVLTADSRPNRPRDARDAPPAVTFSDWAMI